MKMPRWSSHCSPHASLPRSHGASAAVRRAFLVACLLGSACAQAKPPEWTQTYPTGVQQGQSVELTLVGSFDHWPPQVHMQGHGLQCDFGKDAKDKTLNVTAAKDAPPGIHWLRLIDDEGATSLRPIFVGALPELVEKEPNDAVADATELESSTTISGKLEKSNDVDAYRIHVQSGETLVASLRGHRWIGSPMDAVLQICDARGFVLAQNDDQRGLDPLVSWQAPYECDVLVRVFAFPSKPNSTIGFAGGATFIYRLDVTTGPFIDHCMPLTESSTDQKFELFGWNLTSPLDASVSPLKATTLHRTIGLSNAAGFAMVDMTRLPSVVSSGPHPMQITAPVIVSGRLPHPGDAHQFQIQAKAKEQLRIKADAISLGFPLDPIIVLTDQTGKVVAESDDIARNNQDAAFDATLPADGPYTLSIRDTHGRGGMRMVYRLTIAPPAFSLAVDADRFVVTPDKPLELKVAVTRERGFAEEIAVEAVDLPEGITAETIASETKGDTAKSVTLKLASDGKAVHRGPFRIIGRAGAVEVAASHAVTESPQQIETLWVTSPKGEPKAAQAANAEKAKNAEK